MIGPRIEYRFACVQEILSLRHAVLRDGLPIESAHFEGDDDPNTLHFAADAEGRVVACLSMVQDPLQAQPAWRLRGMASDPQFRGQGVGRLLLAHAERVLVARSELRLLWCNARVPAVGFYQKQGWKIISEQFVIETAGPHYRMSKQL